MTNERQRLDRLQNDISSNLELLKISRDSAERRDLLATIRQMLDEVQSILEGREHSKRPEKPQ